MSKRRVAKAINDLISAEETCKQLRTNDISDGSHTFGELYNHRMILFSLFLNEHPTISWKAKAHSDGSMYPGYFIVGINTPQGQYSYHYQLSDWDYFNVPVLRHAPEYDGHKPSDIGRLLSVKETKEG
ncbi:hypothetical protein QN289_03525 [Latilactobacillus curvatus]|uniref:WDGH domain-containing protein n=1 Tax=Latilactobacillus curvatus TaxID=28038 RepID=UPI0024DF7681|nr:hypothetical protein [Latilactobacillus curvatus]WIE01439.1 hypothetical protein QN289_03525 [Latilactobacillus curvatus]